MYNPALYSHTHLQAAQIQVQTQACKRVCLLPRTTDRQSTRNTEGQPITRGIKYWGFCGYSNILPRIKFGVTGQDSSPQSPTFHTRNRYKQA